MTRKYPDRYHEWSDAIPWIGQYILDENGIPMIPKGLLEWGKWMEKHTAERIVGKTKVGDAEVSTVFLGLDHGAATWRGLDESDPLTYKPVLWETMIFGGENDQFQVRHDSKEKAQIIHAAI